MKTGKRKRAEMFMVPRGYRCECDYCEADRAGAVSLDEGRHFCPGCGHGYVVVGGPESRCGKCGGGGAWLPAQPDLPVAPARRFKVTLRRSVEQTADVIVEAKSALAALTMNHAAQAKTADWRECPPEWRPYGESVEAA